ncbi:CbrC family protein [Microscilla marina]|uniref:CbrC family protein n=1 Tax=Microscilla marina ATCC 23134 TaxID=313606 RepID=A1ZRN5_MICM2|nr:CbrC family protein [Microscilla marina]EAY26940.1 conserved hypothetical protein [Microscilla marina ATCC 23134]
MCDLPVFKYNPDPVRLGVIKKERTHCPVCQQERAYVYTGPFYTTAQVRGICPWCIKDGSAAQRFQGTLQDYLAIEGISPDPSTPHTINYASDVIDELLERTPGYRGWQQEVWLSHCNEPCAIIDYVGWKEIAHLQEELMPDLSDIQSRWNISQTELQGLLTKPGDIQGYLFRCVKCNKHRLTIDAN